EGKYFLAVTRVRSSSPSFPATHGSDVDSQCLSDLFLRPATALSLRSQEMGVPEIRCHHIIIERKDRLGAGSIIIFFAALLPQEVDGPAHSRYTDFDPLLCFPLLTVLLQGGMRRCFQLSL